MTNHFVDNLRVFINWTNGYDDLLTFVSCYYVLSSICVVIESRLNSVLQIFLDEKYLTLKFIFFAFFPWSFSPLAFVLVFFPWSRFVLFCFVLFCFFTQNSFVLLHHITQSITTLNSYSCINADVTLRLFSRPHG